MRYSQLFTKTSKEAPADENSVNAQLLIKAGYVYKEMSGVYAYLPLGIRVIEKIKQIVREEMNAIGGQELLMTGLQRKEVWEKTNRWDDKKVDIWFKSQLKSGGEVGLGWSHEEPIGDMMTHYISSYKDLPVFVYQFQTKLRNELRSKSGILRTKEFVMKDLYSFCTDAQQHEEFYKAAADAYMKVFKRVGLGEDTYFTFASGGDFTQFSHEFQTLSEVGEDTVYVSKEKNIAINQEVMTDETLEKVGVTKAELTEHKSIEVGNIFDFGTAKSEPLGLSYVDNNNEQKFVHLGSYGIGITRLMGTLVEKFSDDNGLVWPEEVSPFKLHLIKLHEGAEAIYDALVNDGIEVLYDDRDVSAGEKFADADLIGCTYRAVVSAKTGDKIELKRRDSQATDLLSLTELLNKLK